MPTLRSSRRSTVRGFAAFALIGSAVWLNPPEPANGAPAVAPRGRAATQFRGLPNVAPFSPVATIQIDGKTLFDLPDGIGFDSAGYMYVSDPLSPQQGSVTVYAPNADGNVAPVRSINGASTGLYFPAGIVVDSAGYTYVVDCCYGPAVVVYSPGANGNVPPVREIAGSNTGLSAPYSIAMDAAGYVYVTNSSGSNGNTITVYAPGANGNVAPARTIGGALTGIHSLSGLAVDAAGYVYALNGSFNSLSPAITVYAPGANGNVAPVRTITGSLTGLTAPAGIAVDAKGRAFVGNAPFGQSSAIEEYAPGANGNVKPVRSITGSATLLSSMPDVALDPQGNIYVPEFQINGITSYAKSASGNAAPRRVVATVGSFNFPALNGLSGRLTYWYGGSGSIQFHVQSRWQTYGNPPPPSNGGTIVAYLLMQSTTTSPIFSQTNDASSITYGSLDPSKSYSIAVFGNTCTQWHAQNGFQCTSTCNSSKPTRCGCCHSAETEYSLQDVGSPSNGTLTFPSPLANFNGSVPIYIELVQNPTLLERRMRVFNGANVRSAYPAADLAWLARVSRGGCPYDADPPSRGGSSARI